MKKQWTTFAVTACFGMAVSLSSCGGGNQESVPDNQSIETRDIDSDSLEDNRVNTSTGTTTGATTGSTSGATTGSTTM